MSSRKVLHIYTRVSSDVQLQGYSLQAQELAGIEKAKQLGFDYKVHVDGGKSAKSEDFSNRPALTELLKLVDAGEVSDIFVTETDRLTRSPELHFKLKVKFTRHSIIIHTQSGPIDYTDYDSEFMADIKALMSKRENSLKSARSIRGMKEAVKKGKWIGKILPYGYTKDNNGIMIVDQEESEVYKMMVNWFLSGDGSTTIVKKLNALNIPTRGKKVLLNGTHVINRYTKTRRHVTNAEFLWRDGTVQCILKNPIYCGRRRYKGEIINSPSIIDDPTWERVQTQFKLNRRYSRNHMTQHHYMLKGLIRCGVCGCNFYGRMKSNEKTYMCSSKRTHSCGIRSVNIHRLDSVVWDRVINSGEYTQQLKIDWSERGSETVIKATEKDIETIQSELRLLDLRANKLVELYELGRLTLDEYDKRHSEIKKENDNLNTQFRSLEHKRVALENVKSETDKMLTGLMGLWKIRKQLNELSVDEKRLLLIRLGVNIIINWDATSRCHTVDITFAVNGYSYEKKDVVGKRKNNSKRIQVQYFFDTELLLKSIISTDFQADASKGLLIAEQVR